jgi:asparagine synthase (glutamine-hydrolysing)
MCGIIGRFFKEASARQDLTSADLFPIKHRGPDSTGVYTNPYLQFGHARLAMIDLSDAACQPMIYGDNQYILTYNGEIYNYIELMSELESKGEYFSTRSDTEVLIVAYKVWGVDCIKRFRGMFAFALWDMEKKCLFLARDRCGEKPLFYHQSEDCFSFASEIKGLLPLLKTTPILDPITVDMYLHYQYVPEPFTLLQGVKKLPAAHYLLISSKNWNPSPIRYWDIEHPPDIVGIPTDQTSLLKNIQECLEEAVKLTLRSDVQVGIALSGGLDSGMIAAFAQKHSHEPLHAFSVGYPGRPYYDERMKARELAEKLGMFIHEVELPVESFLDFFPQMVQIMDEPIADPAAFGHYSVPKAASDLGIKALLTGIGGDELFWGYSWVARSVQVNQQLSKSQILQFIQPLLNLPSFQRMMKKVSNSAKIPERLRELSSFFNDQSDIYTPENQLRFNTLAPDFNDAFSIKKIIYGNKMKMISENNPFIPTNIGMRENSEIPLAIMRLLFDTWLVSNCLTLGDRVSMSVGVETRLPFLDVRLIELVTGYRLRYPDHMLGQKAWLREALKGVLPNEILSRPKAGFQPPTYEWLSGVISRYGYFLENGHLERSGVLRKGVASFIVEKLSKDGWPGLFFAYKLILLEVWYKKVVEN